MDYYGNLTPINQTSNISAEEGRSIVISPWDKNLIPEIEKAILSSDLGLNPSTSSDLIRVTMPALTEETRQDYIKQARAEAENSRVSIRNIRRDANDELKKLLKEKKISEDEVKKKEKIIQDYTDAQINAVDERVLLKEKEIMTI